jgi:hypothetical protein
MSPPTCLAFKSRTLPTIAYLFWLKMHESKELVKYGWEVMQASFHLLHVMCLDLCQDIIDCQAAFATMCVLRRSPLLKVVMVWLHSSTSRLRCLPRHEECAAASSALTVPPCNRPHRSTFLHGSNESRLPTHNDRAFAGHFRGTVGESEIKINPLNYLLDYDTLHFLVREMVSELKFNPR